jgi:rare lipoprotein A
MIADGNAIVEVETILPDGSGRIAAAAPPQPVAPAVKPESAPLAAALEPEPPVTQLAAAEPPPATPDRPPAAPAGADAGGIYLQLGAFGSRENAENFLARMRIQVEWLASALQVFTRDGLYRVQAGPYPGEAEARRDADRVGQALGVKPFVLTR